MDNPEELVLRPNDNVILMCPKCGHPTVRTAEYLEVNRWFYTCSACDERSECDRTYLVEPIHE